MSVKIVYSNGSAKWIKSNADLSNTNLGGRGLNPTNEVADNFPAFVLSGTDIYAATSNAQIGTSKLNITIGITENDLPVPIIQPFLVLNYIIALTCIFPSMD